MIDRQNGGIIMVECDSCDAVLDTETRDFEEARGLMRTEGWKVRKIASEWLHGCPRCGVPT
jgi:uncharacterized C2H2 Zn-finger protein